MRKSPRKRSEEVTRSSYRIFGSDAQGSGLNLTGLEDLSGLMTVTTTLCITTPFYRLRVGQWRIIYDRQEVVKIISIEKVKPRGDAYQ